jgi:short-subunit dehydrogenase
MSLKNVLLTGASSGVGHELAKKLAIDGHALFLVGRDEKKHLELIASFPEPSRTHSKFIQADLGKLDQVATVVSRIGVELNWLIYCAGVSATGLAEDIPLSEYERVWHVNFLSMVSLLQQALPSMKKQGSGLVVSVSSGVARRALPFTAPYCSAKAALNSFTDSLRVELAGTGIRILLFSPGPVETRFHANIKHYGAKSLANPPLNGKTPEEIASKLLQAIKSGKERVIVGRKAALAHHLQYWSPKLTDKIIERLYKME